MKPFRILLSTAFALTLGGCASTSTPVTDSHPVSPRHHYWEYSRYARRVPYDAKVVVVRDRNALGDPARARVRVDTDSLASLQAAESVTFYVAPGDHQLSVDPTFHIGPGPVEHTFHFAANQTAYFRVVTSFDSFDIQPATSGKP